MSVIMPSAEDWLNDPFNFVDSLYDKHGQEENWEKKILQTCGKRIRELPNIEKRIPLLNSSASHDVKSGQLVRFRCMVQDMHDPEYYVKRYVSRDLRSGKRRFKCGLLRDLTESGPYEETEMDGADSELNSRLSYYCISIPGENKWIKDEREKIQEPAPSTSGQGKFGEKRSLDDDDDESMESENDNHGHGDGETIKRTRTEQSRDSGSANTNQDTWLNFPIPNMEGKAVIVKVYDTELKLNEMVEVVGVLSVDPKLTQNESMETDSPPVSLVPRLHAILIQKLPHTNVHLPVQHIDTAWKHLCAEQNVSTLQCRQHVLNILKKLTFGDEISAELLLCNLISRVYTRRDGRTPLGSFSLNLFGVPVMSDYTDKVFVAVSRLVERSCKVDMSLQTMNSANFIPKKNYDTNQLKSGYLQLPAATLLLLDETKMSNGQLNQSGVQNLMALGNLIRWQNVEYDFQYHRLDFSSNLPILVLSEGKSLLPCQIAIPLVPGYPIPSPDVHGDEIKELFGCLSSSLLMQLRCYLTVTRLMDYSLPSDMQKVIQEDFVQMRKEDAHFSADDLDQLLVLSKLLSVSQGDNVLTSATWGRAKTIEKERKRRLANRSTPS